MSFNFMKHFVGEGGKEAMAAATVAVASFAPNMASNAGIATSNDELTDFGLHISGIKRRVDEARTRYEANDRTYHQLLDGADVLNKQIAEATALAATDTAAAARVTSLTASLSRLLDDIEKAKPDHDSLKHDLDETEAGLADAQAAYTKKAGELVAARANLTRGQAEVERAKLHEQSARERAHDAEVTAGIVGKGTGTGVDVALNAFKKIAAASEDRAAADELKAKELRAHIEPAVVDDPNIAAAMALAKGSVPTASLTDRLAALRQ
jgi:predicted  nucleic acid-binding Zn-ribbon protein